MEIGVFVTNITSDSAFTKIKSAISTLLPTSEISIDLEDVDKVLRIAAEHLDSKKIINTVKRHHFDCKVMSY